MDGEAEAMLNTSAEVNLPHAHTTRVARYAHGSRAFTEGDHAR